MLGHRNIKNTLVYNQLIDFKDDEYVARVASSEKEACQLIEADSNSSATMKTTKSFENGSDPLKEIS
jgi:hypothetical protein